jgi:glycosyltransferase involved in cell wall biosynthesis
MKVTAHTLIKNEQRWIWYALKSVEPLVDEILVWDTGSTDATVAVVKSFPSAKIKFKQLPVVTPEGHTAARQQMLEATDSDWILILDGDEIWWQDSLRESLQVIRDRPQLSALVSRFINCVGDIHHYQAPDRSRYDIAGYKGPYNLRFINRHIPGLHVAQPHGGQQYRDGSETPLQAFPPDRLAVIKAPYLHLTHLPRSVSRENELATLKRSFKYRFELGLPFAADFVYPEVMYLPRPALVPDPFTRRSLGYLAKSLVYEPARMLKHWLSFPSRSGY